jgi:hypothetical protein
MKDNFLKIKIYIFKYFKKYLLSATVTYQTADPVSVPLKQFLTSPSNGRLFAIIDILFVNLSMILIEMFGST